jgi:hypothetical protein
MDRCLLDCYSPLLPSPCCTVVAARWVVTFRAQVSEYGGNGTVGTAGAVRQVLLGFLNMSSVDCALGECIMHYTIVVVVRQVSAHVTRVFMCCRIRWRELQELCVGLLPPGGQVREVPQGGVHAHFSVRGSHWCVELGSSLAASSLWGWMVSCTLKL